MCPNDHEKLQSGTDMLDSFAELAMGQNPNRTPSEHPNPTTKLDENGR